VTSRRRIEAITRSLLAVVIGLIAFIGLSLLRIQLPQVIQASVFVRLLATLLMYLIPGALVGALAPRSRPLHAAVLGLLTVAVVWREIPLQRAAMSGPQAAQFVLLMALFGVAVSVAGSFAARWLFPPVTSGRLDRQ
jgi:hypothetical protein